MKTTFIYSLSDPDTKEIRYIGKANNLKLRLWSHIHEAKHNLRNLHKCNWIKLLLKNGKKPIIEVIEEVVIEEWIDCEKYWIAQFKAWGFNLINKTEGGECGIISENCKKARSTSKNMGHKKGEYKHSEETKAIIREKRAFQSFSAKTRKKMSEASIGKLKSEQHKKHISEGKLGIKLSKEHIRNIKLGKYKPIKEISANGIITIWEKAEDIAKFYNTLTCMVRKKVNNENMKSQKLKNKFYYINN